MARVPHPLTGETPEPPPRAIAARDLLSRALGSIPRAPAPGGKQAVVWIVLHHALLLALLVRHASGSILISQGVSTPADVALFACYCAAGLALLTPPAWAVCARLVPAAPTLGRPLVLLSASVVLWLAYVDQRVYLLVGTHLYSPAVRAVLAQAELEMVGLDARGAAMVLGLLPVFGAAEILAWVAAGRLTRSLPEARWGRLSRGLALGVGATLAITASVLGATYRRALSADGLLTGALPLREILLRDLRADAEPPSYPAGTAPAPVLADRPDILFVVVDSLRSDAASPERMPYLDAFAREHRCLRSPRHYTGGTQTEWGLFSLLYGLESYRFPAFMESRIRSFPLRVLRESGYELVGRSATLIPTWQASWAMTSQLDAMEVLHTEPAYERDRSIVSWYDEHLRRRRPGAPTFGLLFFDSTHAPYAWPPEQTRFEPVAPPEFLYGATRRTSAESAPVVHRYDNAVAFMDRILGALLAQCAPALAEGRLVLVVTSDHGEELWDHGMFGHNAPRYHEERIQVPLVLCLPGGAPRDVRLSSHMDVMPTILDALGAGTGTGSWSDGVSLLAPRDADRWLVVRGVGFGGPSRELVVIDEHRKTWLRDDHGLTGHLRLMQRTDLDDHALASPSPDELSALVDRVRARERRFLRR